MSELESKIEQEILKIQKMAREEMETDFEGDCSYRIHVETGCDLIENAYLKGYMHGKTGDVE